MTTSKLGLASGGVGAVFGPFFAALNLYIPVTVFDVPVGMYGASGAGAIVSLFFGEVSDKTRKQQFMEILGAIVFGAHLAEPLSDVIFLMSGWGWPQDNTASFSLFCGALSRWYMAKLIKRGGTFIDEYKISLPFFRKKAKAEVKDEN